MGKYLDSPKKSAVAFVRPINSARRQMRLSSELANGSVDNHRAVQIPDRHYLLGTTHEPPWQGISHHTILHDHLAAYDSVAEAIDLLQHALAAGGQVVGHIGCGQVKGVEVDYVYIGLAARRECLVELWLYGDASHCREGCRSCGFEPDNWAVSLKSGQCICLGLPRQRQR